MAVAENPLGEEVGNHLPATYWHGLTLHQFGGVWLPPAIIAAVRRIASDFQPVDGDILLASFPKTGSTWLKALTFAIFHRNKNKNPPPGEEGVDPFLARSPHELVPFLEYDVYGEFSGSFNLGSCLPSPRIFLTHLPHHLLPETIKKSGCRIVYVTRNPKDTLVSFWHYWNSHTSVPAVSLPEFIDGFCAGTLGYGHFFEHVLGYWEEREKLLFLRYEDLRGDPDRHVKRLAEYLGCSLSSDEVMEIVRRCSIGRLSSAEAEKKGRIDVYGYPFSSYFRKGEVGDWKNYLTQEMIPGLDEITRRKMLGSGFEF